MAFQGPLIEGAQAELIVSLASAATTDQTIDLTIQSGTTDPSAIQDLPSSVVIPGGVLSVSTFFEIGQDPDATAPDAPLMLMASDGGLSANVQGDVEEFDSSPYVFTAPGGAFSYDSATAAETATGTIVVALEAAPNTPLLTIQDGAASYDEDDFTAHGTVYAALGGVSQPLFTGAFTLPYDGASTTSLSMDPSTSGGPKLAGLDVDVDELTFEPGELLAGFSLALPFVGGSLTIDTEAFGLNAGLAFTSAGERVVIGQATTLPSLGPVNVFGLFQGILSNPSISYTAADDTLELQGTFSAQNILRTGLSATVDFTGDNGIDFQNGEGSFAGELKITGLGSTGLLAKAGFSLQEIDLAVNTREETLSGSAAIIFPFGGSAPLSAVSLSGSWADGPQITGAGISFSGLNIVLPDTPDVLWQSASLKLANLFSGDEPPTFTGALGFSLGQKIGSSYLGTLTLSGTSTTQIWSGSASLEIGPPQLAASLGTAFNGLSEALPLLAISGTATASFGGSGFAGLKIDGSADILNGFIKTDGSIDLDADFDFTITGKASVDFASSLFSKVLSYAGTGAANFIVSYTNDAPLTDDYAEAWFTLSKSVGPASLEVTVGAKIDFAGDAPTILYSAPDADEAAAPPLPETSPPRVGASPPGAAAVLLLTASWTHAAEAAPTLTVTTPDGQVIDEADFAAKGIAVLDELSTAYAATVAILSPGSTSGWSLGVNDTTDLGVVRTTSATPEATPALSGLTVTASGGGVAASYDVGAVNGGATLTFFASPDGALDGVEVGAASALSNGSGSAQLDLAGLTAGDYQIYGVLTDGQAVPQTLFATGEISVSAGFASSAQVVSSGQSLTVSSGQSSAGLVDDGDVQVLAGGAVADPVLIGTASMEVYGSAASAVVSSPDEDDVLVVEPGGVASGVIVSGGVLQVYGRDIDAVIGAGGYEDVLGGVFITDPYGPAGQGLASGSESGGVILSGGVLADDGEVSGVVVASGGVLQLGPGAVVASTTFEPGAQLDLQAVSVASGSVASDTLSLYSAGTVVAAIGLTPSDAGLSETFSHDGAGDTVITFVSSAAPDDLLGVGSSTALIGNANGAVVVGQLSGGQLQYSQVGALGPEWTFESVGDYLGTGQDEILLKNTTGAVVLGQVGSGGQLAYTGVSALGPDWSFEGSGDLLGDGQDQFLIQNTGGATVVGEVGSGNTVAYTQVGALGGGWSFHGVGEFLADGKEQYFLQNSTGALVLGEVTSGLASYDQVGALGPAWTFEGVGDFLGDGKSDILIRNTSGAVVVGEVVLGQMTYDQVGALGTEWAFQGVGDFGGTGQDSFLIQNTATGAIVTGTVVSGTAQYAQVGALGSGWSFPTGAYAAQQAAASKASLPLDDLNGNGVSDVLLQYANGAVVVAELSGGQLAYQQVSALGAGWTFEGVGDYAGDGKDQFLIFNTNGAVVTGEVSNGLTTYDQVSALGPGWSFVGTGDYLADGKDQFLIWNADGSLVLGEVSGGLTSYQQISALGQSDWSFKESADFFGDGKSQFLIQNQASGALVLGEVSGGLTSFTQVGGLGPGWTFEGAGDFLGDGKAQFLMENTSGAVVLGEVDNNIASYVQIGALGPSDWTFVGVGDYAKTGTDSFLIENTATGAIVTGTVSGSISAASVTYATVGGLGPGWTFHR